MTLGPRDTNTVQCKPQFIGSLIVVMINLLTNLLTFFERCKAITHLCLSLMLEPHKHGMLTSNFLRGSVVILIKSR